MDKKIQQELTQKNGLTNELYVQEVRKAVGDEYYKEDELAIHRKAIAYLFEQFATFHAGEIDNAEFAKYNAKIEQLKSNVKTELGMK